MSLVLFLQELRLDLLQAGLPLYIYKYKGLAGLSEEDVAVHPPSLGEFVEFVAAMFFVQYCVLGISLHQSLDALLLWGRRHLYLEAMEEAQVVLLQPARSHHDLRDVLPRSQFVESRLYGQSLLGMHFDASEGENQYEGEYPFHLSLWSMGLNISAICFCISMEASASISSPATRTLLILY